MNEAAIRRLQSFGLDVYMLDERDSYLFFTDGVRIGYMQSGRDGGAYSISTVHLPNQETGTGFQIGDMPEEFTMDEIQHAFAFAPEWATSRERASVRKYKDINAWLNASSWNKGYKLVQRAT